MSDELPAQGFWHGDRPDVPHEPPADMTDLEQKVFTALQVAFLAERARDNQYVSFLDAPIVSLDGKFRVDEMARYIAAHLTLRNAGLSRTPRSGDVGQ